LPLDFCFSKVASFKAVPARGKLLPGTEHTINLSFEPKSLGMVTQEMTLEILNGVYKIPLKLSGHCNKVGQRAKGIRGPMATQKDFEPARNMIEDDEAEARTLAKHRVGPKDMQTTLAKSYGVQAALGAGNIHAVEKFAEILENKKKANDFVTRERLNRERDVKIQGRLKATNRLPPETLEEIEKDPDLGMDPRIPSPRLLVPSQVDLLYVEKPIDRYEPSQSNLTRLRHRREADLQDRIVKRKWKAEPQTQAEVRDCSVELSGDELQKINAGPQQINFKTVFVKSSTTKSFIVTNDLRQHIYVRLLVD